MSLTMPIEALLVGTRLGGFAQLVPALHAANVRDVDAMIDFVGVLDSAISSDAAAENASAVALCRAMIELTSPRELDCLVATMRELRACRELIRAGLSAKRTAVAR